MKMRYLPALISCAIFSRAIAALPMPLTPAPAVTLSTASYEPYLVIIEGDYSRGTGFIANFAGKPYVVTNTHVLDGNKQFKASLLNGTAVKLQGGIDVAAGESSDITAGEPVIDVSRIQQTSVPKGLEIIGDFEKEVAIGDDVIVLGNSEGRKVVTDLRGKVTGIGPDRIELDARFVEGNSGSPVIHVRTGKVIGIAAYAVAPSGRGFGKDSRFQNQIRRFAFRLDNIPIWESPTWPKFVQEGDTVVKIHEQTKELDSLIKNINSRKDYRSFDDNIKKGSALDGIVKGLQSNLSNPNLTKSEAQDEIRKFFHWVGAQTEQDLSQLKNQKLCKFHQRAIENEKQIREAMKKYFDQAESSIR